MTVNTASKDAILVLGMHRSGTSAVTGALGLLGATPPKSLIGGDESNERGYFESIPINRLNNQILESAGSVWSDWREFNPTWLRSAVASKFHDEALSIIEDEFQSAPLIVLKDPRICRMAPFWQRTLADAGYRYCNLLVVRNPLEVAQSLHARNGFPIAQGLLIWLRHTLDADFHSRDGVPRSVLMWSEVVDDWREAFDRVAAELNLAWPRLSDLAAEEIDQFFSPELRHHKIDDNSLRGRPNVHEWAQSAYEAMKLLSADPRSNSAREILDRLRGEFDRSSSLYGPAFIGLEERLRKYGLVLQEAEAAKAERDLIQEQVATRDGDIARITQQLSDRERELDQTRASLSAHDSDVARITEELSAHELGLARAQLSAREDDITRIAEQLSGRERELDQARDQLSVREQDVARIAEQLSEREHELDQARDQLSARDEDLTRIAEQVSSRERELDSARAQLSAYDNNIARIAEQLALREIALGDQIESRDRDLRQLRQELAAARAQASSFEQDLAVRTAEQAEDQRRLLAASQSLRYRDVELGRTIAALQHIETSTAWRITGPLRRLLTRRQRVRSAIRRGVATIRNFVQGARPSGPQPPLATEVQASNAEAATPAAPPLPAPKPLADTPPTSVALTTEAPLRDPPAKVIAFYLPQFHPIPENDEWWGKGFTEWTNVSRGAPQFVGHHQPHQPGELGYYDLRIPTVQERQAELAKLYGVSGFCFYFYWFSGKTLLESPILQFSENPNIDFPFCLCWANENWSRRWDGLDAEILIGQKHSAEDDLAFIAHISKYLRHKNYIKVDGKPLLMVYRPSLLPDARATAQRWRDWCRANDIGEIFLAYTQSFEANDPRDYGFDAAVEFPPNNSGPPDITDQIQRTNPEFQGKVYDYRVFPARSESYSTPDYTCFRGVFPSWDNEARRRGRGTVFHHASPELFERWVTNAVKDAVERFQDPDKRLVFVNAWNEWAEGAHLEPDQRYGYAWLQAMRNGLAANAARGTDEGGQAKRLVLVTHDCWRHGAQYLSLALAKSFSGTLGYDLDIVTLGDGPLKADFAKYGRFHDLTGRNPEGPEARALAQSLAAAGARSALCNSTVSGLFAGVLADAGLRVVALVHELSNIIRERGLEGHANVLGCKAAQIVFPSQPVSESFRAFARIEAEKIAILPQGLYKRRSTSRTDEQRLNARRSLRSRLAIPPQARIVLAVAYGDHRKGVDLFVQIGLEVMSRRPDAVFVWVGDREPSMEAKVRELIDASPLRQRFVFLSFQADLEDFYAGADIFALTSREDPFPSVMLDALDAATPVVAFAGAGGFETLIGCGTGCLVADFSVLGFAAAVEDLLADEPKRIRLGDEGRKRIDQDYSFHRYVLDINRLVNPDYHRLSAIVPNYNYSRYLPDRLASIDKQSYAPYEIILLDDASKDDSVEVAKGVIDKLSTPVDLVENPVNSGSVFRQWHKGVERARGELVWIAEADDLSEPEFLEVTLAAFADPDVVMSYCQSKMIDEAGHVVGPDYLSYVADVDALKWKAAYVADGRDEIAFALSIKNTIPNVSAVVFRREVLRQVLDSHIQEISAYRVAGDWFTYLKVLEQGKISFDPRPLNRHRRHTGSVTIGSFNASQLREIISVQQSVIRRENLPRHLADRAMDYARSLYVQFGLDEDGRALEDHPLFQEFHEA